MEENKINAEEIVEESPEAESKATDTKAEKKKCKKTDAEVLALKKELEKAQAAYEECNDKYLRMMAEYDNFRKRRAKEKDGIYADAFADCIGNMLPILDNLERASKSDNLDAVKKGLDLTVKAFEDAMQKMGVTEVETKTFDPNLHNAVMHVEDDQFGESEIVEVFQKGYCKGDKIIRYAMVKVAN